MTGKRILVIGNAPDALRALVTEVLDPHGYQAVIGTNRDDGLHLAVSEPADLLILDLTKPAPWGMDVIEALREAQRNLPIVLTLAPGSEEMAIRAFRLGVKDCVVRPFEVDDMLATIAQAMQDTHLNREYDQRLLKLIETNQHLERQVKELSTLHAVGKSVTSYLDLEWVLRRVVEASVYITHAEEGYLLLLDQDSGELYIRASQNVGESQASGFRLRVDDSIAGQVVRTGEPVILSALSAEQTFKVKTNLLVRSLLNVPLKAKDRIIGVLGVDNRSHSEPFTKNDLRLLTALAEYAVVAIENASLYKRTNMELERRVHELSVIHGIAQELNASLGLDRTLDLVIARLMDIVPAAAALMMFAANGQQHWRAAGYLQQALMASPGQIQLKEGIIGRAVEHNRPVLVADVTRDPDWLGYPAETRSQIVVPIQREGQVIGIMSLESQDLAAFDEHHLRFLVSLAEHAAVALENARLFEVVSGEQRRNKQILACVADGVFTVDRDLRILSFNAAAEQITGWKEKEVVGRSCAAIFRFADDLPDAMASRMGALLLRVMDSQQPITSVQLQGILLNCNGRSIPIAASATPLLDHNDRILGAVSAFRDISTAWDLEKAKDDFIAMVSHELRSPLSSINASVELINQPDMDRQLQQEMLDIVQAQSTRLTEFVKQIVDVSQIKAGQLDCQLQPMPMLPVVRRVLGNFRSRNSSHHFELLSAPGLPFALADETKVEIILTHLLENASQFSPEGTTITVELQHSTDNGSKNGEVIVSVADEGIGIALEYHEKIFDQFFRANASDAQEVYGEGLGLYISKRLVEMQGGRIWVESQGNQGARFSFSLPGCEVPEVDEPMP